MNVSYSDKASQDLEIGRLEKPALNDRQKTATPCVTGKKFPKIFQDTKHYSGKRPFRVKAF
ncbi:MAG: hypothetical protein A2X94_02420 [Bdellovibrionales bacterium GWB1_55_8]|nr:MAG: hypothetical protein A2X94_02420 [Bdellovibrionales bacterium GWB1_55_8]